MLTFQALGAVAVTNGEEPLPLGGPRQRRLVAMLLVHRNTVVSSDRLVEAVFAGEPTPGAATTLRSYVARLRRVLADAPGAPELVTRPPGYVLAVADAAFDVACFERALADAATSLARAEPAEAAGSARRALALWQGPAYAEFADEEWARPEAQRLEELHLVAHERWVEAEMAAGHSNEVIPALESLVAEHPLREVFWRQLVVARYRTGRQADALRAVSELRAVLRDEVGLDPTPAIVDLERRVLEHDPALLDADADVRRVRGYRLGERLGSGRDGTVHAAALPGVERELVIRVYRRELADAPSFVRDFDAMARTAGGLRHPGLVTIQDHWREPGAAYLVMRRLRATTLAEALERGTLRDEDTARLVDQVGGALAELAGRGIAHGRIAAENVWLDAGGPVLGDIGFEGGDAALGLVGDVRDFARLVERCVDGRRPDLAEALACGREGRVPMAELVALLGHALVGPVPRAAETKPNPYKGLEAFDEGDEADFFGRADALDSIAERLVAPGVPLVLVVGGSGTGKSSAVRAGLLPRVRRGEVPGGQHWFVATMLPGAMPWRALAGALRDVAVDDPVPLVDALAAGEVSLSEVLRTVLPGDGELLLVIDQFEELFTLADEHDRRGLLDELSAALTAPDCRLRVVATLRADHYDRPLASPSFGPLVAAATVTLPPLTPTEVEQAIVEPIERVGGTIEPALVAELMAAVVDEPAALPSLQFTLFELVERRPDRRLTAAASRELGGLSGAIAARADELYRTRPDDERELLHGIFERLFVIAPNGEPTRRRTPLPELAELAAPGAVDAALEPWVRARLLTRDHHPQTRVPTVEVAHEAVLRTWPRLRGWIDEDRARLRARADLRTAAAEWIELGRDTDALYRGARLQTALDATDGSRLPGDEQAFLAASTAARDAEAARLAGDMARQVRANRRLRVQLALIAGALVVALVVGVIALQQRRHADAARRIATGRELAAAADANLDVDPELSMLLALRAVDHERDGVPLPEAVTALHRAVGAARVVRTVPGIGGAVAWSPDGRRFVTEGPEESGIVDIRDADTGASLLAFHGHDLDVNDVAFNADGSLLATTGDDGALRVWDPQTGALVAEHVEGGADTMVWGPSFSPDGSLVAASWPTAGVAVSLDVRTGEVVHRAEVFDSFSTAFSPDGTIAVALPYDGSVALADPRTGAVTSYLRADGTPFLRDVAFSPDGRWLAGTTNDGVALVWDMATGEHRATPVVHASEINGLAWSPDSTLLATAGADGKAALLHVDDSSISEVAKLSALGTRNGLMGVAFSPDGSRLLGGDAGTTAAVIWDATIGGRGEWLTVPGAAVTSSAADLSADGSTVVVAEPDRHLGVWDVASGTRRLAIADAAGGESDVVRVAISPDGARAAAHGHDGAVRIFDLASGASVADVDVDAAGPMAWSGDGSVLAIAVWDGTTNDVIVVDGRGEVVATHRLDPLYGISDLTMSPTGDVVAFTRLEVTRQNPDTMDAVLWDWRADEIVTTLDSDRPLQGLSFDPSGQRLAMGNWLQGSAEVWDVASGTRTATLTARPVVHDIAVSPNGDVVATANDDGIVRLWDLATGVQRQAIPAAPDGVWAVSWSADGRKLVTVGNDATVRVLAVDVDDLVGIATQRVTRGLDGDECRQYLHVATCPR